MNALLVIVALAAALCVVLLLLAMRGLWQSVPVAERHYQDPLPPLLRLLWPLVTAATHAIAPRLSSRQYETAHKALQTAGQDYVLNPEELYGVRVVGALAIGLLMTLFPLVLAIFDPVVWLMAFAFGLPLGWSYPLLWLGERRKKRAKTVIRDLPTYLDFITMSVEAGLNITGAIEQSVLRGPPGPLGQEFGRMLRDLRAGLPRAEALKRMAERMDIGEVTGFASAVIQADKVGANLSETLRAQAMQRREERFLRAEKLALEAPVKMMFPLVVFFFPQVFLVLAYFIYSEARRMGLL
jgi:tight adherence protein C